MNSPLTMVCSYALGPRKCSWSGHVELWLYTLQLYGCVARHVLMGALGQLCPVRHTMAVEEITDNVQMFYANLSVCLTTRAGERRKRREERQTGGVCMHRQSPAGLWLWNSLTCVVNLPSCLCCTFPLEDSHPFHLQRNYQELDEEAS